MAEIKKILVVCGEPSGDLLAGKLVAAMQKSNPQIKFYAVGGLHLAKTRAEIFYNISGLSVMGFFDVLKKLPRFLKLKKIILEKIASVKPDCLILVDFSGFNLRLAAGVNKSLPVIYYVSPQIWASREGRINSIRKYISKLVVLFKFEEEFYARHHIQASFAGHPLVDAAASSGEKQNLAQELGIDPAKKIIALLPGSRKQEVKLILPLMLKAAGKIEQKTGPAQFILARSPNLDRQIYLTACKNFPLDIKIIEGRAADCLKVAQAGMVCSGTATLEAAITGKPFVIVYKMGWLNYLLYRPQVKIPYIGMVNIVAGEKIVPEFIQSGARPEKIASSIIELLENPEIAGRMSRKLKTVKDSLGEPGASERAAKIILDFLKEQPESCYFFACS